MLKTGLALFQCRPKWSRIAIQLYFSLVFVYKQGFFGILNPAYTLECVPPNENKGFLYFCWIVGFVDGKDQGLSVSVNSQ